MNGQAPPKSEIAKTGPQEEQGQPGAPVTKEQPPQAAEYPHPCQEGQARKGDDLCAQWVAAVAARDSASWEARSYEVEVYGAVGVGLSLFFSAWAAILALRAFRSTQRTEIAQTRAYIFPESVALGGSVPIAGTKDEVSPPLALCVIRNYGNTPAHDIQHWGLMEFGEGPEGLQSPDVAIAPKSNLPPGGTSTYEKFLFGGGNDFWLTPVGEDMIRKRTAFIFVHGRIEYRDVYGTRRFTNYRLEYTGIWPPRDGAQMRFSVDGNESD